MRQFTPWDDIQRPEEAYNVRLTEGQGRIPTYWGKEVSGKCLFLVDLEGDHVRAIQEAGLIIHGIEVDLRGMPHQSKQRLVLSLVSHLDRELFHALCNTLIRSLRSAVDTAHALEIAIAHLKRWQKFLAGGKAKLLTAEEIRGLYAEVDLLRTLLGMGVADVGGWQGPDGADQDFLVGDVAVEVKSVPNRNTSQVSIASESQLDSTAGALFLVVKNVVQGPSSPSAQSLNEIVREIRGALSGSADREAFLEKLSRVGYEELDYYSTPKLQVSATRTFEVREGFPRLIRSALPAGIFNVRYNLDIGALEPFECPINHLWDRLCNNGLDT